MGINEKLRELEKYIMCDDVNNDELWHIYWGIKNSMNIPKHETVEQWEKRKGEIYPDDGPVYPADIFGGKPCYKDCRSYRDAKIQNWRIISIANHHGKPND